MKPANPPTQICAGPCGASLEYGAFGKDVNNPLGIKYSCKACVNAEQKARRAAARAARLASDHAPLRAEDYDVSVGNMGGTDAKASAEKRQEYSKRMGAFHSAMRTGELTESDATYIAHLGEQERRFQNRRVARSLSLNAANEALHLAQVKVFAEQFLADKIAPAGYARKRVAKPTRRACNLLTSDTHFGSELSAIDNPVPFRAIQEARRWEHVVRETIDCKKQYREHTELIWILNGDIIEGFLEHDMRDGAPLAEQYIIFWKLASAALAVFAAEFPRVRVVARPGNHGRNKQRHPGRATSSKWDGHEWTMYYGLMMMSRGLGNVTWDLERAPLAKVDVFGQWLGVTHADTEVKLGPPDNKAGANALILDKINANRLYGVEFAAWAFGHYHKGVLIPGRPGQVWNAALVPPNGYARGAGYFGNACGQWLWESVPGHVLGDSRFVEVGPEQDADESLGQLIQPFRLDT